MDLDRLCFHGTHVERDKYSVKSEKRCVNLGKLVDKSTNMAAHRDSESDMLDVGLNDDDGYMGMSENSTLKIEQDVLAKFWKKAKKKLLVEWKLGKMLTGYSIALERYIEKVWLLDPGGGEVLFEKSKCPNQEKIVFELWKLAIGFPFDPGVAKGFNYLLLRWRECRGESPRVA